jgi:spoIIIJ-associated protein
MSEYQEFTGKTVEEALRNARDAFGATGLDDLDFEILTPGSRGVLGMGAEPARIIAAPRSALGGAAPRREAAATTAPAPTAPTAPEGAREAAPPVLDRPAQGPPTPSRPPVRDAAPRESSGTAPEAPPRDRSLRDRGQRDRGGRGGRPERGERRGTGLSPREADEVASARASTTSREEIQAAEASPESLAAGREIVEQLIALMGYRATVSVATGATSKIDVRGVDEAESEALGALIGRKGERLSALQHLVNLMLSRKVGAWTRVLVDVEDYRGRRERQLVEVARRAAERVLQTGTMLQLDPMPALERRWVHLALRDIEGVSTQSIGEEPMRRIVIIKA